MPLYDQYERHVFELAEQRRQNAIQDRQGTVYQVYSKNGETKVRLQIGTTSNGQPWLTPWLNTEDHRGSHREEQKFYKGQNVKVSAIAGNWRMATVTPHAEGQNFQRPDHATDNEHTYQYDTHRETRGKDWHEHWLAQKSNQNQSSQQSSAASANSSASIQMQPNQTDDSSKSLHRALIGIKPQNQQAQNGPWDGPQPTGGSPKGAFNRWIKGGGSSPPPNNKDGHILHQVGDKTLADHSEGQIKHTIGANTDANQTSTLWTDGSIVHTVGQSGSGNMLSAAWRKFRMLLGSGSGIGGSSVITQRLGQIVHQITDGAGNVSTITHTAGAIMHQLQGQNGLSSILHTAENITMQVGASAIQITGSNINISTPSGMVNVNTVTPPSVSALPSPPAQAVSSSGAVFVGYIKENILNVLYMQSGYLDVGLELSGSDSLGAILANTTITGANNDGTYTVSPPQNIAGASFNATTGDAEDMVTVSDLIGAIGTSDILVGSGVPTGTSVQSKNNAMLTLSDDVTLADGAVITGIVITAVPAA